MILASLGREREREREREGGREGYRTRKTRFRRGFWRTRSRRLAVAFRWASFELLIRDAIASAPKFNGNANAAAAASERKHASGVTYIPYQHLTGVGTPEETPRGPLSTSETDDARSYKYQPTVSRACIGNSRVTDTRLPPPKQFHVSRSLSLLPKRRPAL